MHYKKNNLWFVMLWDQKHLYNCTEFVRKQFIDPLSSQKIVWCVFKQINGFYTENADVASALRGMSNKYIMIFINIGMCTP